MNPMFPYDLSKSYRDQMLEDAKRSQLAKLAKKSKKIK